MGKGNKNISRNALIKQARKIVDTVQMPEVQKTKDFVPYTEEVKRKLMDVFKIGGTVDEACKYVGIAKQQFYNWTEKDPNLLVETEKARAYPIVVARNIVIDSMIRNKDINLAKWYLEKTVFVPNTRQDNVTSAINSTVNIVFPDMVRQRYDADEITGEIKQDDKPELSSSTSESL